MRVCMLVYNTFHPDVRVLKEAVTLTQAGYEVQVIAYLKPGLKLHEEKDGFQVIRVERNPVHLRLQRQARRLRLYLTRQRRRVADVLRVVMRRPPVMRTTPKGNARRPFYHRPLMLLDYYRRIYSLVSRQPVDVYHAHDLNTLPVAALLARRNGAKLVYDSHELFPETSRISRLGRKFWRIVERVLIRRSDLVITVSDARADLTAETYRVSRPEVIRNCPPLHGLSGRPRDALRRMLLDRTGFPDKTDPVIFYSGRLLRHRGLERLIEAVEYLNEGIVVLLGWGDNEVVLRAMIESLGLSDRVRIAPPVQPQELLDYTAGATIGTIPIEPEGLNNYYAAPNKLFEYMAAGLPIVASRLPETIQFVEGYEIGLTCEPGDPRALADAINRLLGNAALQDRMRANALAAAKLYNWERESEKLVELYYQLESTGSKRLRPGEGRVSE